jgi:hypothetical protein
MTYVVSTGARYLLGETEDEELGRVWYWTDRRESACGFDSQDAAERAASELPSSCGPFRVESY